MTLSITNLTKNDPKKAVLFDHDGSVDDFLSLMVLLSIENIDLIGISITPADCYAETAFETTHKLLEIAGAKNRDVAVGSFNGVNSFPSAWRAKPKILNALPSLINIPVGYDFNEASDSIKLIILKIQTSKKPVTVMMTGPCSNLVSAIEKEPSIINNIEEIVWMGGAIDVPGNVVTYNHDGSAEWNIFWDPDSARKLLTYGISITLIPLDITNQVPVDFDFLKQLARQGDHSFSNIAAQFWSITMDTIPSYEYIYFMWDVLATSYLAIPEAFETEDIELDIILKGPSTGRCIKKPNNGHWVTIGKRVNKPIFYKFLLDCFNSIKLI